MSEIVLNFTCFWSKILGVTIGWKMVICYMSCSFCSHFHSFIWWGCNCTCSSKMHIQCCPFLLTFQEYFLHFWKLLKQIIYFFPPSIFGGWSITQSTSAIKRYVNHKNQTGNCWTLLFVYFNLYRRIFNIEIIQINNFWIYQTKVVVFVK